MCLYVTIISAYVSSKRRTRKLQFLSTRFTFKLDWLIENEMNLQDD